MEIYFIFLIVVLCLYLKDAESSNDGSVEARLKVMEKTIHEQEKRILLLEKAGNQCRLKIDEQAEILKKQDQEICGLKHEKSNTPDNCDRQLKLKYPIEADFSRKNRRLLLGSNEASGSSKHSAFYAYLSHHEINPGNHHTVIFDFVKTNTDGSYSNITGAYTAPYNGIYGFIYSIRMGGHAKMTIGPFELLRNNVVEGVVFVESLNIGDQETVTGNAIIHAEAGDKIFLRTHTSHTIDSNIYSDINGRTSFSGWLIYSDE